MSLLKVILTTVYVLSVVGVYGQTNIDPRQYVDVFEVRDNKREISIWDWNENGINQKQSIVDKKSVIKISFDKGKLTSDISFKGNLYIEAILIGDEGGENPAEVLPYTRIGEDKTLIGIPNRPAEEIASIFLNLLIEHQKFTTIFESTVSYPAEKRNISDFRRAFESLGLILKYNTFFKESGEDAEDAFLSLISLDYILFDKLDEALKSDYEKLRPLFDSSGNIDEIVSHLRHAVDEVRDVIYLPGTVTSDVILGEFLNDEEAVQEFINTVGSVSGEQLITSMSREGFIDEDGLQQAYDNENIMAILVSIKPRVIRKIAEVASHKIFSSLDYATIDLLKENGQEGDVLYVSVILVTKERRAGNEAYEFREKKYPVGRFHLRKTGWDINVSDSFFLINRINESTVGVSNNLSPSNFKGAPGVTLSATFLNNGFSNNGVFNFLEPSIGLDVSYVDFYTDKDVEIGVGALVGLFDNRIFGVLGLNLNSTKSDEVSPWFVGIGFSFARIGEKIF